MQQEFKTVDITKAEILPTAERMKKEGRMLVMIHGLINTEGQPVVSYEYAVDSVIEAYEVTGETELPSISGIYDDAAGWPEREINELLGFTFENLDTSKRLFLPEELSNGKGQILVTPLSELRASAFKEYDEASTLVNTLERDESIKQKEEASK